MDESILEFITEGSENGSIEYIEPVDENFIDFQDEELLLDNDIVLISDDDIVSDTEDNASEDIIKSVDEVVSTPEVQNALPIDSGSINGSTYNIYNINLTQTENISEVPEEEQIQEDEPQEAITENQYSIDDIYSKLDGIASDVSVLKSNNYNHSQNMEKIGLTVVGLCVALLGGLVAYSVFNHIRP